METVAVLRRSRSSLMGVLIGFVCGLREFCSLAEINFDFVKL